MKTIGQIFREAREARNVSLYEAAEAIRVKSSVIEDLEADRFSRFPAAIYARGFIKLYAEFLRLDPAPLLVQFSARLSGAPLPEEPETVGESTRTTEETVLSEHARKMNPPSGPELPLPLPEREGKTDGNQRDAVPPSPTPQTLAERERVELPPRAAPLEHYRAAPSVPKKSARTFRVVTFRMGRMLGTVGEKVVGTAREIRQWPWGGIGKSALAIVAVLLIIWGIGMLGAVAVRKLKERPSRPVVQAPLSGATVPEPDPLYLPDPFVSR